MSSMNCKTARTAPQASGGARLDLSHVRERLASKDAPAQWRSLEEIAGTPEFEEMLHREFPQNASEWADPVSRRSFLKLMSASFALAGLSACTRQPTELIVPYVRPPEEVIPGRPQWYATALTRGGVASGVLVESHQGRPIKVEGNPDHPASKGGVDATTQAEILQLYDPDRSQAPTYLGDIRTWSELSSAMSLAAAATAAAKGMGFRILTETVTSPTLAAAIEGVLKLLPGAKWHQWDPLGRDAARAGARLAFGEDVDAVYHLDKADVILSLDADFLGLFPGSVRYTKDFSARRRVRASAPGGPAAASMSRLYAVEPMPSVTGGCADHRLTVRASEMAGFAAATARALGVLPKAVTEEPSEQALAAGRHAKWIAAMAKDLAAAKERALVIPGEHAPPEVHHIAHAINAKLGAVGTTVTYIPSVAARAEDHVASLRQLCEDMKNGEVATLLVLGANPVYTAPPDLGFAEALQQVPLRIHCGPYQDETAVRCHWHIPAAHELEAWGDARAFDGTVSIQQPLIAPLYGGKGALEALSLVAEGIEKPGHERVKAHWKERVPRGVDFEVWWRRCLHDGVVEGSAPAARAVSVKPVADPLAAPKGPELAKGALEVVVRPDPQVLDGRLNNNGWLQEMPRPLTRLTWDNAAHVSPRTAEARDLRREDVVTLTVAGRTVKAAVWVQPGVADDTVVVHLGYGRTRAGRVGTGTGFDAGQLRGSTAPWGGQGLELRATGEKFPLASTQEHFNMAGRHIVRSGTLAQWRANPRFAPDMGEDPDDPPAGHGHGGGDHGAPAGHGGDGGAGGAAAHGGGAAPAEPGAPAAAASGTAAGAHEAAPAAGAHGAGEKKPKWLTMYADHPKDGNQWAMVIDLNACTGCNACVTSCQSENNTPVVGKDQVMRGREMQWMRIDRYYEGSLENPRIHHMPMFCQHCENASCEVVCPVAATAHSPEGLNEMVYNRCVGTRYCSNNCPYKVRRFNFLLYTEHVWNTPVLHLMQNPDVTVRSRGVMEKCTYCVQRINQARITAKKEGRGVRDGEIVTACQSVCPADAIVFGDMNDVNSRVSQWRSEPSNYGVISELGTRPRTTYLAPLVNVNPEIEVPA
jgi:molybdopterin-containing oxidoreductase family iron-sulfur binding subunit